MGTRKTAKKPPATLELNPVSHEIRLQAFDYEKGTEEDFAYCQVSARLCDSTDETQGAISSREAREIGEWFLRLSEHLASLDTK